MSAIDVVSMLDDLFHRFDDLCFLYGLEKIKTIGVRFFFFFF